MVPCCGCYYCRPGLVFLSNSLFLVIVVFLFHSSFLPAVSPTMYFLCDVYFFFFLCSPHYSIFHMTLCVSLTESLVFWGFQGGSAPPPWASILVGQGEEGLGLQERYLPLGLEAYGCTQTSTRTRKDMELLRTATGP